MMDSKLIVHTIVTKVDDGAITEITLEVKDKSETIYKSSFDICKEGTVAKKKDE